MTTFIRILLTSAIAAMLVGPISSATTFAATQGASVAQTAPQSTGGVNGVVKDNTGAPVAGATIRLEGKKSYSTISDAKGAFSVTNMVAGFYTVSVYKAGYQTARESQFAVFTGETETLAVELHIATLTSLRTIARITSNSRAPLNDSTASINVVTNSTFVDQGTPQVTRVLNQIPGVQISFPSSSGAAASSPGAISFPTIRGAAAFETASLIDGHPLSVGQYGDYVTTFLNSGVLGSVETIKGPGATSPQVNYAIGGTINFRTREPSLKPEASLSTSFTNHGGTYSEFSLSNTVLNGRLGFVAVLARNLDQAAYANKTVCFDPTGNSTGGVSLAGYNGANTSTTIPGTSSSLQTIYPLLACGETLTSDLDSMSELLKFRYRLSSSTRATVSYLGGQAFADQNANTGSLQAQSAFSPLAGAGYTGSIAPGAYPVNFLHPGGADRETNNEPIFQAEIQTTLGKDTLLGRFYHASIDRLVNEGNPGVNAVENLPLFGTSCSKFAYPPTSPPTCTGTVTTYNGQLTPISFNNYYQQAELDKLAGLSFEYNHPVGDSGKIAFSVDQTRSTTTAYSVSSFTNVTLPTGSGQAFTTLRLMGDFFPRPKLETIVSLYQNIYQSTYPTACPFYKQFNSCKIDGSNVTFATSTNSHFDPRFGLVYRPKDNVAVRFSAGSAIAPPYLALLSQITTPFVTYSSNTGQALITLNNGSLKPETAFGYDLGADVRLKDDVTVISGDVFMTNLFNHFFQQTSATGQVCGSSFKCSVLSGTVPPAGTPVLAQSNINLSNARFAGIELSVKHDPKVGFGYDVAGSLQRGYVYNLPPYFYCTNPAPNCTQNQNLNILPNQNFNGGGVGIAGLSTGAGNVRIPYAQGNFALSYRTKNGAFFEFGETLMGKNNSLNQPPYGIGYLSVRYPVMKHFDLQLSGDNVFNTLPGYYAVYGGGVSVPLVNGLQAATYGNTLGPATYRLVLSTKLGGDN